MEPNPIPIDIDANSNVEITCISNAAFFQRVTIVNEEQSYVFLGTGEGAPMKCSGLPAVSIPAEAAPFQITAKFEYSINDSSGPYQIAVINNPASRTPAGNLTIIEIQSEDGADIDNNDSWLTLVLEPQK